VGLVDELAPRSRFEQSVAEEARSGCGAAASRRAGPGIALTPLEPRREATRRNTGTSSLTIDHARAAPRAHASRAPDADCRRAREACGAWAPDHWGLSAFRELDDALLDLRTVTTRDRPRSR
jgi:hypothetical protein